MTANHHAVAHLNFRCHRWDRNKKGECGWSGVGSERMFSRILDLEPWCPWCGRPDGLVNEEMYQWLTKVIEDRDPTILRILSGMPLEEVTK